MTSRSNDRGRGPNASANGATGGMYGLGFIGALIFFIQEADTFMEGIVGVFKALVWPAFLVYKLFESLYS